MSVGFGTPVTQYNNSSANLSLAISSVTSGQPLIFVHASYNANTALSAISDNFPTPYTWMQVDTISGPSIDVLEIWIGTGGSGTSGTVSVTCTNFSAGWLVACNGASTAGGLAAIDQHDNNNWGGTTSTTVTSPTLYPLNTGDGAIYAGYGQTTLTSTPGSPWTTTTVYNYMNVATQLSPTVGSGLSTAWTQTSSAAWCSIACFVKPAPSQSSVIVSNTTNAAGIGYSNQRKLDHFQNGYKVAGWVDGSNVLQLYCDGGTSGVTWTLLDDSIVNVQNFSMFIDLDDNIHIALRDTISYATPASTGGNYQYYVCFAPNAGRTSLMNKVTQMYDSNYGGDDVPNLVAFRDPAGGGGWVAHIVWSLVNNAPSNITIWDQYSISSSYVATHTKNNIAIQVSSSVSYANGGTTFPSIDFQHTGDGKTAANSSPKLYCVMNTGKSGTGYGIQANVSSYSGGAWTWTASTPFEVDTNCYMGAGYYSLCGFFDGTRFVAAGDLYYGPGLLGFTLMLYDTIDTTPVVHQLIAPNMASTSNGAEDGSVTYDINGNVYIVGSADNSSKTLHYYKWTRSGDILSGPMVLDTYFQNNFQWCSAKRNTYMNSVEIVYAQGASSPYSVKYDLITVTPNPTSMII